MDTNRPGPSHTLSSWWFTRGLVLCRFLVCSLAVSTATGRGATNGTTGVVVSDERGFALASPASLPAASPPPPPTPT
eukprot:CAMPEP_0198692072 /NCGR_PEP_ID=MMETSP1468-20131203/218302_1 /TAXON_ID=1461545 /ORGANISM="Mantoniella sp, Strain CCMP1436" /LENGTH=76 /DNA_ID=CAMNT_0044445735 /DNA_START=286 /DNA_END=512 /DNA_ORIENTATION=+